MNFIKAGIATAAVITCCLGNNYPANAQNAPQWEPGSWQAAVDEYNAYDRIQFQSEWAQNLLSALRDYEAGK